MDQHSGTTCSWPSGSSPGTSARSAPVAWHSTDAVARTSACQLQVPEVGQRYENCKLPQRPNCIAFEIQLPQPLQITQHTLRVLTRACEGLENTAALKGVDSCEGVQQKRFGNYFCSHRNAQSAEQVTARSVTCKIDRQERCSMLL